MNEKAAAFALMNEEDATDDHDASNGEFTYEPINPDEQNFKGPVIEY